MVSLVGGSEGWVRTNGSKRGKEEEEDRLD